MLIDLKGTNILTVPIYIPCVKQSTIVLPFVEIHIHFWHKPAKMFKELRSYKHRKIFFLSNTFQINEKQP